MKKRFTEEQIIGVLKEAEAGLKVSKATLTPDKHGVELQNGFKHKA